MHQAALDLGDNLDRRALRHEACESWWLPGCSVAVRGAASGCYSAMARSPRPSWSHSSAATC